MVSERLASSSTISVEEYRLDGDSADVDVDGAGTTGANDNEDIQGR